MRTTLGLALCAACASSGDPPGPRTGTVALFARSTEGRASAAFPEATEGCTEHVIDAACSSFECGEPAPPEFIGAGTIDVQGAASPITLAPELDQRYRSIVTPAPLFVGGETLVVTNTGAEVHTFEASVIAPSQPTITMPAPFTVDTPLTVDRTKPFHVEWTTARTDGQLVIKLSNPVNWVTCRYPAADQRADIPPTTLATLPFGHVQTFEARVVSATTTTTGRWHVVLEAAFEAVWPDTTKALGGLLIQ